MKLCDDEDEEDWDTSTMMILKSLLTCGQLSKENQHQEVEAEASRR